MSDPAGEFAAFLSSSDPRQEAWFSEWEDNGMEEPWGDDDE